MFDEVLDTVVLQEVANFYRFSICLHVHLSVVVSEKYGNNARFILGIYGGEGCQPLSVHETLDFFHCFEHCYFLKIPFCYVVCTTCWLVEWL